MTVRVLLVATEWWPSKGGVSSFNVELALALRRTGFNVDCVVPRASAEEIGEAVAHGVVLHSAARRGVADGSPFDIGGAPDIIVGHDRWSGPEAARWRQRHAESRLAILLHVHPAQIDGLKSELSIADRARRVQEARLRIEHADVAFAVGDELAGWWAADVPTETVHTFLPGLPRTLPAIAPTPPPHPRVLLLGRAEDAELKGVTVAARAMRVVADSTFPDAELVVRGLQPGTEVRFENEVRADYPKPRRFHSRHYDPSRRTIAEDLVTSTLILQPSLEEGFGLVTFEAIAAGTPVLVSSHSGAARLIERIDPAAAERFVFKSGDETGLADAIIRVLRDIAKARCATDDLRRAIDAACTWDAAAQALVTTTLAAVRRAPEVTHTSPIHQLHNASTNLAELPRTTDGRWITRAEQAEVSTWLSEPIPEQDSGVLFLVGAPGTGKSAILSELVERACAANACVLGIKADFVPASVDSLDALRAHLGLRAPIAQTMSELLAVFGAAVLVIDQLDALCEVVDSRTTRLHVLLQLVREVSRLDGARIVVSIRPFELRHEARLRMLHADARVVLLDGLELDQMRAVLPDLSFPEVLDPGLKTPHALDLLVALHRIEGARFAFPASVGKLRERFWSAAVGNDSGREAAARELGRAMTRDAALWVDAATVQPSGPVEELVSVGLLRRAADGTLIGFRHQTFFDLVRAQDLVDGDGFMAFIREHVDSLEVRPRVRSALLHLRTSNADEYQRLAAELLDQATPLHLRLLAVDTIVESDTPTRPERDLLASAVAEPMTRRRALNGVAHRPGWLDALSSRLPAWIADYAVDATLLAAALLRFDPAAALGVLQGAWTADDTGRARTVNVLTRVQRLGAEADVLLEELIPHLVRFSDFELETIAEAVAIDDPRRAASFYAKCLTEQARALEAGDAISRHLRIADGLLGLEVDVRAVLDELEPLLIDVLAPRRRGLGFYAFEEVVEQLADQLLQRLATSDPLDLLTRATRVSPRHRLQPRYLRVLGGMEHHTGAAIDWVTTDPTRLAVDPESVAFLDAIAARLNAGDCARIEAAIDCVTLYPVPDEDESPGRRRDRERANRAYRLCLRERLPSSLRDPKRVAFDDAERHQLPHRFELDHGPRGGIVQSPMTIEQLSRASNANVLTALETEREPFRYDEHDLPIGGADEILGQLRKLAEDEPQRVAELVDELRQRGRLADARRLLPKVAEHHSQPGVVESLCLSLFAGDDAPLDVDEECAWALEVLARRAPLRDSSVGAILLRLEQAQPTATSDQEREEDEKEQAGERRELALFRHAYGGGTYPGGAFRWLDAIAMHLASLGVSDHALWVRAIRAGLRAEPRIEPWRFGLDHWRGSWRWLAGDAALELVDEIALSVFAPSTALSITRVYAGMRNLVEPSHVEGWARRLVAADMCTPAAELACLVRTDRDDSAWAESLLSEWRRSDRASAFSPGVLATVGALFDQADRRSTLALLAEQWLGVARAQDVELLISDAFCRTVSGLPDASSVRVLRSLGTLVAGLNADGLRAVVFVLESFLDVAPDLVLEFVEDILARALEIGGPSTFLVVSECLALSFSLRLALPSESARAHALLERALAADVPAAFDALDTADGRAGVHSLHPVRRRPRRRLHPTPRRLRHRR